MIIELQILKTLRLTKDLCYSILVETNSLNHIPKVNDYLYSSKEEVLCKITGVGFLGAQNKSLLLAGQHLLTIKCIDKEFSPVEAMNIYCKI